MMGDHSFQSFFCLCSIIKEIPEAKPQKEENDEHLVQSLKEKFTDQMSLEDMVNVFEEMCDTPFYEKMILFETGTFTTYQMPPVQNLIGLASS